MPDSALVAAARLKAQQHGLDPALICAIAEQESAWNPWAIRYEPAFYARYVANLQLAPTEAQARATSWGLGQVMGQAAREVGFQGRFLSELCDPWVGLEMLCRVFKDKLARAHGDVPQALLYWNGGSNPSYPSEVLARKPHYV